MTGAAKRPRQPVPLDCLGRLASAQNPGSADKKRCYTSIQAFGFLPRRIRLAQPPDPTRSRTPCRFRSRLFDPISARSMSASSRNGHGRLGLTSNNGTNNGDLDQIRPKI
jgi:hypothetical protein